MIAVVVALGANRVEIPCLTFATGAEANTFCADVLGPADASGRYGGHLSETQIAECADSFFRDYYDGCGGVYSFEVREVAHGKPIACFDLD
jgi:hypothetical protein